MFDSVITIVEKLIDLKKYQEERHRRLFESTVRDLQAAMQSIHSDYMGMFEQARLELSEGAPFSQVARRLMLDRTKLEGARRQVINVLREMVTSDQLSEYRQLFISMDNYFRVLSHHHFAQRTPAAVLIGELYRAATEDKFDDVEKLVNKHSGRIDARETLQALVTQTIDSLRITWEHVSALYAKALQDSL